MHVPGFFKRCSLCGTEWNSKEDFLADSDVQLQGYQWDSVRVKNGMPSEGMLVFTHRTTACGTSITISARQFRREK